MLRNQCPCYALLTYRTDGKANESRQVWNIASTIPYILFKKDACTFHLIKQIFSVAPPFIRRGQFSNFSYSNPTLRQNKEPKQDQTVKKKLSLFTTPKSFDHIHLKLLMTIYQK